MKRFTGGVLALVGGAATVLALVFILTGRSEARVYAGDLSVNALMGGLIGVTVLTLGLVWARD